ncbi:MAG: TonB family protein [Alphaproteobacteria bacterium]|nr:TonB family protein [Alphaproteobacteria bacterium]
MMSLMLAALLQTAAAPSPSETPARLLAPPTQAQVMAAWPQRALVEHRSGKAVLKCRITEAGTAEDCGVVSEAPKGYGFGAAAISVAKVLKFQPAQGPEGVHDSLLDVPVAFGAPNPDPGLPRWVERPSGDDVVQVYPEAAIRAGVSGRVVMKCAVDQTGALRDCAIVSESPAGYGFGAAALELAQKFAMTPMPDAGPGRATITIPIQFEADPVGVNTTYAIRRPIWVEAPTFADVDAARPKTPSAASADGRVMLRCFLHPANEIGGCRILQEAPPRAGFGAAALRLVSRFRLAPLDPSTIHGVSAVVDLDIRFPDPASPAWIHRQIGQPLWVAAPSQQDAIALFPAKARAKGIREGTGVADCVVAPGGGLSDCRPLRATPPDLGFAEAAVEVVSGMRMSAWSALDTPVDGARLEVPVRFVLPDETPRRAGQGAAPSGP